MHETPVSTKHEDTVALLLESDAATVSNASRQEMRGFALGYDLRIVRNDVSGAVHNTQDLKSIHAAEGIPSRFCEGMVAAILQHWRHLRQPADFVDLPTSPAEPSTNGKCRIEQFAWFAAVGSAGLG